MGEQPLKTVRHPPTRNKITDRLKYEMDIVGKEHHLKASGATQRGLTKLCQNELRVLEYGPHTRLQKRGS